MRNVRASIKSEDGFALVFVLLALLIVSGVGAAMVTSGKTEVIVSVNHERAAQARAAADAGLTHGISLTIEYLRNWQANGFVDVKAAMTALLRGPDGNAGTVADNGSLAAMPGIPLANGIPMPPARIVLSAAAGTSYEVFVMDEDDAARGLSGADHARILEDGTPTTDANEKLIVRATGYAGGGTVTTLEATISRFMLPAIVTNDNLTISGNPTITGSNGSVHSNANLAISGSPEIAENATATGTYTTGGNPDIGGQSGGGRTMLPIPPVIVAALRPQADFILESDGHITNQDGTPACDASAPGAGDACEAAFGWVYGGMAGGKAQWRIVRNDADPPDATFYVEGDARITGSPGSEVNPVIISIIAEGDIEISGNPDMRPWEPELMLVTNGDLLITGALEQPITFEGQILVHEQLHIAGHPSLSGQIIVENAPSVSNLVLFNEISGNPTITYNGLVGTNTFHVSGWREIR
jgi:hypothetical protein